MKMEIYWEETREKLKENKQIGGEWEKKGKDSVRGGRDVIREIRKNQRGTENRVRKRANAQK